MIRVQKSFWCPFSIHKKYLFFTLLFCIVTASSFFIRFGVYGIDSAWKEQKASGTAEGKRESPPKICYWELRLNYKAGELNSGLSFIPLCRGDRMSLSVKQTVNWFVEDECLSASPCPATPPLFRSLLLTCHLLRVLEANFRFAGWFEMRHLIGQ